MKQSYKVNLVLYFSVYLLIFSCSPTRFVKPIEKQQQAVGFSFGGPLINFSNTYIPIPLSSLSYAYGLTDKITTYAGLHTTSLLFGNLQTDMGALFLLYSKDKNKFGITANLALQQAYNLRNRTGFRVWPSTDINVYYHIKEKPHYIYAGLNSWFEFSKYRAHQEAQPINILPNMHLGFVWNRAKFIHQVELKYLGIGIPNQPNVVTYLGIGGHGALGVYYNVSFKF